MPAGGRTHTCTLAPMSTISTEARALLESDALAHLVTLNRDGSPQVSVVWVGWRTTSS